MPEEHTSSHRDAEIAARLKEIREGTGLTRVAFCRRIGLDSSSFANYEHCRAALPWSVAKRVCVEFDHSIHWLASGAGHKSPCEPVPASVDEIVGGRLPLAKAWDMTLRPVFSADSRGLTRFTVDLDDPESRRLGLAPASGILKVTSSVFTNVELLPEESLNGYCDTLLRSLDVGYKAWRQKVEAALKRQVVKRQRALDTMRDARQPAEVKTRSVMLRSLSATIKAIAARMGGQAALARELNVSRQSVSLWIKGVTAPDAEHLLLIQRAEAKYQAALSPGV